MSKDLPKINREEFLQKFFALKDLSIAELTELAEKGDMHAQYHLGCYYRFNESGSKEKDEKGFHWFKKAAKQGHPFAQNNMACCYMNGRGVKKDEKKAISLLQKSIESGFPECENNLGNCYFNGIGVVKNVNIAVFWYQKAADKGNSRAQANLGACYSRGLGVKKDYMKAIYWYKKAAKQENEPVYDAEKAMTGWSSAAELGDPEAQFELVKCYYEGRGVPKNLMLLKYWLQKAIEQNSKEALQFIADHPEINLAEKDVPAKTVENKTDSNVFEFIPDADAKISQSDTASEGEFIYCMECGTRLPGTAKFCYKCGKKVNN